VNIAFRCNWLDVRGRSDEKKAGLCSLQVTQQRSRSYVVHGTILWRWSKYLFRLKSHFFQISRSMVHCMLETPYDVESKASHGYSRWAKGIGTKWFVREGKTFALRVAQCFGIKSPDSLYATSKSCVTQASLLLSTNYLFLVKQESDEVSSLNPGFNGASEIPCDVLNVCNTSYCWPRVRFWYFRPRFPVEARFGLLLLLA
jgi:hypothetical protein